MFSLSIKEFILSVLANVAAAAVGGLDFILYASGAIAVLVYIDNWLKKRGWRRQRMLFGYLVLCAAIGLGVYGLSIIASGGGTNTAKGLPDLPYIYASGQVAEGLPTRYFAVVANGSLKERMLNVVFQFNAITTDKPRIGAGTIGPIPFLDRGFSISSTFELEHGAYFILIEANSGRWRESLSLDTKTGKQTIRVLAEDDKVLMDQTMPLALGSGISSSTRLSR